MYHRDSSFRVFGQECFGPVICVKLLLMVKKLHSLAIYLNVFYNLPNIAKKRMDRTLFNFQTLKISETSGLAVTSTSGHICLVDLQLVDIYYMYCVDLGFYIVLSWLYRK